MFYERSISLESLISWLCWIAGFALTIGDMLDVAPDESGLVGVAFIGLGHLSAMRHMLARQEKREVTAFNLGQKAASVRTLPR